MPSTSRYLNGLKQEATRQQSHHMDRRGHVEARPLLHLFLAQTSKYALPRIFPRADPLTAIVNRRVDADLRVWGNRFTSHPLRAVRVGCESVVEGLAHLVETGALPEVNKPLA